MEAPKPPIWIDLVANIRQNVHQRPVASVSIVCIFNKIHFLNTSAAALPATAAIHDQTPGGNPQPPRCGSLTPSSCINKMESLKGMVYFKHRARLQMISMFGQLPAFELHDTAGPSTPRSLTLLNSQHHRHTESPRPCGALPLRQRPIQQVGHAWPWKFMG